MTVFIEIVFPLLMLLFPLAFCQFIATKPDAEADASARAALIRRVQRRLNLWTGVAVLGFAALLALDRAAGTEIARYAWIASFPLWFGTAMPLLQSKDPGWQPLARPAGQRAASLARRDLPPPALRVARLAAWGLWLPLAITTLVLLARGQSGNWWLLVFPAMGAVWLIIGTYAASMSAIEAEPMDAAGTPALAQAYAELRAIKHGAWFGITALAMLVFCLPALLVAWDEQAMLGAAIWTGAGGGGFVGVLGGVFGVIADVKRSRIRRLYGDLTKAKAE